MLKECTIDEDFDYLIKHRNYYDPVYVRTENVLGYNFNFFNATHKWKYNKKENEKFVVLTIITKEYKNRDKLFRYVLDIEIDFDNSYTWIQYRTLELLKTLYLIVEDEEDLYE